MYCKYYTTARTKKKPQIQFIHTTHSRNIFNLIKKKLKKGSTMYESLTVDQDGEREGATFDRWYKKRTRTER